MINNKLITFEGIDGSGKSTQIKLLNEWFESFNIDKINIREPGGNDVSELIRSIQETVSIPVMAKCRIGHFVEAQILESLEIDYIDESEVLTPADEENHIDKTAFKVPFVCGATNLGEALRRIGEGAALIRTKGEPGTGNVVEAVRHMRTITDQISMVKNIRDEQIMSIAKELGAPFTLLKIVKEIEKLPVPNFSAGGIATPADAALMMQLGAESVFVGSGIFKSEDPKKRAEAIVQAATYFDNPDKLAEISRNLKNAMEGLDISDIPDNEMLQNRGW